MANIYHLPDSAVNVTALPVSGRFLAHNHCSPVERAFMAADLFRGATQLVMPTMVQAAHAARVNVTYAWWANRRLAERAAIEAGQIPLAPAKAVNSAKAADWFAQKLTGQTLAESLAPEFNDTLLINIARTVGSERMLAAACVAEAAE